MVSFLQLNTLAFAALAAIAFCAPVMAADSQPAEAPYQQELQDTLKDAPAAQQKPAANPYADIPEAYIQEAGDYYKRCAATANMYQYYDCKCLATKYLDIRMKTSADYPRDMILASLQKECFDASEAAGYEYEQCIAHKNLMPAGNIPIEDYCTCMATTYAKLFENSGISASSNTFVHLRAEAITMCQNPELEQQLYPPKKKKP